ncbi:uncharacterized protein LOC111870421 [Cryptotermes secundus]|uniref:uncharacterized protein LOC111870421 n=1 Tax=Cryptotermes secundus TaxID=105785 RepID=UPI000CD7C3AC|nr:uncharacterized protein LOC111870421 [Cryptotermes secundus]
MFGTPGKHHSVPKRITNPDDFDISVIRRTVYEETVPTVGKLLPKLRETINFKGGSTSLKLILRKIGFKRKKTRNNRGALIERDDIRSKRVAYLRAIKKYREEGRTIIYEDETFIHSSHTRPKNWTDDTPSGYMAPVSNATNYQKWLTEKLIPNLPPKSVLVVDNAQYHNVQFNKAPTSQTTKAKMMEWLTVNNVPFHDGMLKIQLYDLIKAHKPLHKNFVIDNIMTAYGHTVLRLPPCHPDLNPNELVWADVKSSQ